MNKKQFLPFDEKIRLTSPVMHGEELSYIADAFQTNEISTEGGNIYELEFLVSEKVGCRHAIALSSGTAALHMAVKLAGVKPGDKVFCSDLTSDAAINPVVYEGGIPIFIDEEYNTWNMDPAVLELAFEFYPDVKVVVYSHIYGTPGRVDEIRKVCDAHGAFLIEDAAESFGATYKGKQTGSFGTVGCLSFDSNKIITGSAGGMLLTNSKKSAEKVRKWSAQAREDAPWFQHTELGYNYRMSNIVGGVLRGQLSHLEEHIQQKKAIYMRYKEGFKDLPVSMNPYDAEQSEPNFWLSCMVIEEEAMCHQVRGDVQVLYTPTPGLTCPTEILEVLAKCNVEARPLWKPMHHQPFYLQNEYTTREGDGRAWTVAYLDGFAIDVGKDLFRRGLCLPSDIKMTAEEQERVIEIVRSCFE